MKQIPRLRTKINLLAMSYTFYVSGFKSESVGRFKYFVLMGESIRQEESNED